MLKMSRGPVLPDFWNESTVLNQIDVYIGLSPLPVTVANEGL